MAVISTWFLSDTHFHVIGKWPHFSFVLHVGTQPVPGECVSSCVPLGISAPELPGLLTITAWPRALHPSQQWTVTISQSVPVARVRERRLWGADMCASKCWETLWRIQLSSAQFLKHPVLKQVPAWVWSSEQVFKDNPTKILGWVIGVHISISSKE